MPALELEDECDWSTLRDAIKATLTLHVLVVVSLYLGTLWEGHIHHKERRLHVLHGLYVGQRYPGESLLVP